MAVDIKKALVSAVMTFAVMGQVGTTLATAQAKPLNVAKMIATGINHKNPEQMAFLHTVILHVESGNRRYDANGELLTSRRGAKGEMQVMPHTVADPGYGVAPAENDSPDEYARVGRDYFNALVREYKGDLRKSFAAYNAGPQKVNKAVVKAKRKGKPGQWITYLPRETKQYVKKSLIKVQQAVKKQERVQVASAGL